MGKLKHGHNDKLPEGWERSGSQCDKTILKMGGTQGNVSICGYGENKRVGGNVTRMVVIQM